MNGRAMAGSFVRILGGRYRFAVEDSVLDKKLSPYFEASYYVSHGRFSRQVDRLCLDRERRSPKRCAELPFGLREIPDFQSWRRSAPVALRWQRDFLWGWRPHLDRREGQNRVQPSKPVPRSLYFRPACRTRALQITLTTTRRLTFQLFLVNTFDERAGQRPITVVAHWQALVNKQPAGVFSGLSAPVPA
jgi:hypothetical protein